MSSTILFLWNYFNIEIILISGVCYILLIYLLNSWFKFKDQDIILLCVYLTIIMLVIIYMPIINSSGKIEYIFNNYFIYCDLFVAIKKIILLLLLIYFIALFNFNKIQKLPIFEFLILVFLSIFGLFMIMYSNHLFIIFLFLELVNLCVYCLLGLNKDSSKGIESAFKYFIQSSYATIIGFFGVSLVYLSEGTLFINELGLLAVINDLNWVSILGLYFIILSIFFKLGIFPLHSWIADVYQGAFLISLIFIAIFPKIIYVTLFFKLYYELSAILKSFCLILSGISIIYGSIITMYQTSFRRLLAYGSMVHIGLMIYSISIFSLTSIVSGFYYLMFYIILIYFIFFLMFLFYSKNKSGLIYVDNISEFYEQLSNNTILTIFFIFILFSLAGLPFFIGFLAKWYVFISLIDIFNVGNLIIFLCISVLAASYYVRIIRFIIFLQKKKVIVKTFSTIRYSSMLYHVLIILFILNLFIFFFHNTIYLIILKYIIIFFK